MNKQDLINEIRECRFGVNESITDIDELWRWINQNYISKEEILELEYLVNEDWDIDFPGEKEYEGITRDKLRNEIKQQIIDYKNKETR